MNQVIGIGIEQVFVHLSRPKTVNLKETFFLLIKSKSKRQNSRDHLKQLSNFDQLSGIHLKVSIVKNDNVEKFNLNKASLQTSKMQ